MHTNSKIHLVDRRQPQSAIESEPGALPPRRQIEPVEIVRETLAIAHECGQTLSGIDLKKDQLLIELVASLVVVRLRKAGAQ